MWFIIITINYWFLFVGCYVMYLLLCFCSALVVGHRTVEQICPIIIIIIIIIILSRFTQAGIENEQRFGRPKHRSSIPASGKNLLYIPQCPDRLEGPSCLLFGRSW